MTNKVAYTLAAAALELGFLSLRFNFRGVGRSAGQHDAGRGEVEDVVATVDWLRTRGDGPLLLAGFSFGAQMALRAAAQRPPAWLVTVGTPGPQYLAGPDPAVPQCPWLAVHGEEDEVVDCATTRDWLASLSPPPRFESVPDTGHFFHRRLVDLRQRVVAFLASHGAGR